MGSPQDFNFSWRDNSREIAIYRNDDMSSENKTSDFLIATRRWKRNRAHGTMAHTSQRLVMRSEA